MLRNGAVPELEVPDLVLEVPRPLHALPDPPQRLLDVLHVRAVVAGGGVAPLDALDAAEVVRVVVAVALDDDLEIDDLRVEVRGGVVEADLVVARGVDGFAVRVVRFAELADEGDAVGAQYSAGDVNN